MCGWSPSALAGGGRALFYGNRGAQGAARWFDLSRGAGQMSQIFSTSKKEISPSSLTFSTGPN
jgi:hypothetical protein